MKIPSIKDLTDNMVDVGLITAGQLDKAKKKAQETGGNLGDILISEGYITEDVFMAFLGKKSDISYVDLSDYGDISPGVLSAVPESFARKKTLIPVKKKDKVLTVAIADPMNVFAIDDLRALTGLNIEIVLSVRDDIKRALDKFYGSGFIEDLENDTQETQDMPKQDIDTSEAFSSIISEISNADNELEVVAAEKDSDLQDITRIRRESEGAPVVKMVNLLILNAIKKGASDIHIEPFEKHCRIRYRVDGVLHLQPAPPRKIFNSIVARLKVMASLDVAEKRRPQDGRIKVKIGKKEIDLRTSFLPSTHGEKVVMRILDSSSLCLDLTQLGFDKQEMVKFNDIINAPNGIILVTGPTGSGKTTTLYSTLTALNRPDVNINTIEDPVEYMLKGVIQVQARPDIDLTFAAGLRTFLRQDPDIIMVGEIRDTETAQISINAALTGHLVLSTLHTNDAPSAVTRLDNMGIEAYHISSTVILSLAQRLVRKVCPKCKAPYEVDVEALSSYGLNPKEIETSDGKVTLFKGSGCSACSDSGYKGRIGIYEMMVLSEEIKKLINLRAPTNELKNQARKEGMRTLRESCLKKVLDGKTTVDEMLRVTAGDTG